MLKKRKNIVLFTAVMVTLLAGGAALYFGSVLYLRHRAIEWKRQGIAASVAGDDSTATQLLLRYLHRHPDDTEALTYYVTSRERSPMADGQQYAETIAALKLLIQQRPANIDDRIHLLELYVKLERAPEALDIANQILVKAPNQPRVLQFKTQLLTQTGQDRGALETANHWAEVAPDELAPQLARLGLEFRLERPPGEILAQATALRESHPNRADFEVLQGFAYAHAGDDDRATHWLKSAAAHPDLSPETARVLVEQLDGAGLSADALAVLQDLLKRNPQSDLRFNLAQRLWEQNRWQETVDVLEPISSSDPKADANMLAFKCISLSKLGRAADAAVCRKALAGSIDPAAHSWTLVLARMIDGTAVDDQKIVTACRTAISSDPQNTYLTYYLGEADSRLGELDLAIDAFRRAAALNSSWNLPAMNLVECLMKKGKPEQALDVASYCARRHPNDAASVITLARAWEAGIQGGGIGQSQALLDLVNQVQKQLPGEDRTQLIQIQLLGEQKKYDEAARTARLAISRVPAPEEDVFRIVALLSDKYSLGLKTDCYTAWEHAVGNSPGLASARAVDRFNAGQADAGLALFDSLSAQSGKGTEMNWQLARAQYLDLIGNAGAKTAWVSVRDQYPTQMAVQEAAVRARAVQGDWSFLTPVIDNLHKLSGDAGLAWRLAQASLMVESPRNEADYEKGSVELNELIQRYPNLPEPHVMLARALVHMRRTDGAVQHLTAASKLDPTSVPIALQLSALLQSQGDFERVNQELDRITPQLHTREQRQQAALLLSQQNDPDRALQMIQPATSPSGASDDSPQTDSRQQLLLAMLYRQRHETARADAIARKLMEQPDLQSIQFAASLFLSEGLTADAEAALRHLDELKLEPGIRELAMGWFYARTGEIGKSAENFQKAVADAPQLSAAWTELAVTQLLLGKPQDAVATIAQASRALPGDTDFSSLKEHSAELSAAGSDRQTMPIVIDVLRNPSSRAPLMELLQILLQRGQTGDMEHCAASLQTLTQRHPECLQAQVQLAQCYLNMNRSGDAVDAAQHMMSAFPKDPEPARIAVLICKSGGRWKEMEAAAQNWKDRLPEAAEPADCAMAEAETMQQNPSVAIERLQPYLVPASASPDHHANVLTLYAVASAENGDVSAASNTLWPLASKSADWRRVWLSVALQLPDGAAATDWLQRAFAIIAPADLMERVAAAEAFDRLGRRLNDSTLISRASEICDQAGNDPHAGAAETLAAGAQAERTGRFADAEQFYHRAIDLDPTLWMAENNLAMLMMNRGQDLTESERLAQMAIDLRPQDPQLEDTLAQICSKAGKPQSAVQCMQKAVKLEPDNVLWRIRLAQYLFADGDRPGATQAIADIDANRNALNRQPIEVQNQLETLRKSISGKTGKL